MDTIWFKAKRFGWGWTPATWQGWLILAGFVAGIAASAFAILGAGQVVTVHQWMAFYAAIAVESLSLIVICYKTGERPRWRWGSHDDT
jgi:hypothetical protein